MSKIQELLKEKLIIRVQNPERASILGMLVDNTKKMAKDLMREATDEDLPGIAKKMKNESLKAIEEYKKGRGDYSHITREIAILEEFIPAGLSEQEIKEIVTITISSLPEDSRSVKNIMPLLKSIPGMDMKTAKTFIDQLLA